MKTLDQLQKEAAGILELEYFAFHQKYDNGKPLGVTNITLKDMQSLIRDLLARIEIMEGGIKKAIMARGDIRNDQSFKDSYPIIEALNKARMGGQEGDNKKNV